MCVEDRAHAAQRVSGDSRDLRFGAATDRKPRHRRSAQVMERNANDTGALARLAPRGAEAIGRPRLAVAGREHDRRTLRSRIERGLKRCADRDDDGAPAFGLAQANLLACPSSEILRQEAS
jgi:hypothetical protein